VFIQFCKYFFLYILRAKTRQRLLFLAIVGLFLSSFALIVLQGTMGGLQHTLIKRSKTVNGLATIFLKDSKQAQAYEVSRWLDKKGIKHSREYELEMLLRNENYISPVVVHAVDLKGVIPSFLEKESLEAGIIAPTDLAIRLSINFGGEVKLISPSHVDTFMGDIPRLTAQIITDIITTDVPEVDMYHVWCRLEIIQNLIRARDINRIKIFDFNGMESLKKDLEDKFGTKLYLKTWEEQNSTLVWALKLETTVMVFLFIAMTMLVSLCITSGLMIFFDKIKNDMASFWILGASQKNLERASLVFLNFLIFIAIGGGLGVGLLTLFVLDHYELQILPDVFVDRKIPVHITSFSIIVSLVVPYTISILFSVFSLNQVKKSRSYLKQLRTIG
jgi:lipoprotein-releasing system permease protein